MNISKLNLIPLSLASLTILTGTILVSSIVSADDSVVDEINITVPVSCTMTGTGMDSHNANINNGLYVPDIGSTTLHAFCNDNEGFAIYAAGYTGNEIGGTNSNKLVGTTASSNATIVSGTATTAGNPDISNWAMKLAISQDSGDTTSTNAFTIDSAPNEDLPSQAEQSATSTSFSQYHVVPNEYAKVAHKNSGTDMTATTGGVKLTATYAAYISKTQPADTYSGQVIYTLVHPSTAPAPVESDQIGVLFHGNGQTFVGGKETNRVVYGDSYSQLYTTATPEIIETSNLTNGEQNGSYTDSEYILETRTFDGASKIKVEVEYGITGDSFGVSIFNESWDGDWSNWKGIWNSNGYIGSDESVSDTRTFIIDGDTVTVYAEAWNTPVSGYDYGFSAKIYPIYTTEQENTIPLPTEYYASNTPEIIKTSNISDDGTQNGAYAHNEYILETRTFEDAAKVRVDVKFDIAGNSARMNVFNEPWDGDWDNWKDIWGSYGTIEGSDDISGTTTYLIDGNTVTIYAETYGIPESGYDYGFYARIFPIYDTEHENTTPDNLVKSFGSQIGSYSETIDFDGYWYIYSDNGLVFFKNETALMNYIEQNRNILAGTTIDVYAYNPNVTIACNPTATAISQMICMQDFASLTDEMRESVLDSMTPETQYILIDSRDNKMYTIAKFPTYIDSDTGEPIYDVWMTKNLDLDIDENTTYTNKDTDLGYNTTTNSYEVASWTPIHSTYRPTTTHTHEWCQGGMWDSEYNDCEYNDALESYDPGNLYWNLTEGNYSDWDEYNGSCSYDVSIPSCDQSVNPISTYTSTTGVVQYHLGNYYNWAAALATNDSSAYIDDGSTIIEQSICPAGWTLPRIGKGEEDTFYSLWEEQYRFDYHSYKDINNNGAHDTYEDALWTNPLFFTAGGSFNGRLINVGVNGAFWSPIPYGNVGGARDAFFDVNGAGNSSSEQANRGIGYSVRCILRPVTDEYLEK